ncbi:MAG: phosphatidylserine decarboxylase [Planctomycetes bacterium]|nr:phosphatidylserine decarboxylase [Planctomycetota bacterium]
MADTLAIRVLRFLPRNLISRAFGFLARRERPRFLVRPFMRWFARRFDLDLSEAERDFEAYPSLLAMFTRRLLPGARPIAAEPDLLVSPVDGRVGAFGRIEAGRLVQAKGIDYGAEALLGDAESARRFARGSFITLYLSPRDYHRIHVPREGAVAATFYEPGTLWPVNPPAVRTIPALFAVNERVTSLLETDRGAVAVAMVGATNVGSIALAYDELVSNRGGPRRHLRHEPPIARERGDELGIFQLGSTVVLLIEDEGFRFLPGIESGAWYPMGSALGRFGS